MNLKDLIIESYRGQHSAPDKDSGSPLYDVTLGGIYPDDFYSHNGARYYTTGEADDIRAYHMIKSFKGKPNQNLKIYRSIPKGIKPSINVGDWVTISRQYAKDHGENSLNNEFKIVSKTVSARDIFTEGNSLLEWGYYPQTIDMKDRYLKLSNGSRKRAERIKNGEKIIGINKYPRDNFYENDEGAVEHLLAAYEFNKRKYENYK